MRSQFSRFERTRAALTLIELVVVMAVLVALAALVIPRLGSMTNQAGSATSATNIGELDKAVNAFEAKNGRSPNGWDGILTGPTGSLYAKLHPNLSQTSDVSLPILTPMTLTSTQLKSLNNAGITFLHYNTDTGNPTGRPSDSGISWAMLDTSSQVASLAVQGTTTGWTAHGSTFADRAFNLNPFNYGPDRTDGKTNSFVVFGVGQPCDLRGGTIQDSPIVQSANPTLYYARMLVVYRIPGPSDNSTNPPAAAYVGSFCPDGTCVNDNVSNFRTAASN